VVDPVLNQPTMEPGVKKTPFEGSSFSAPAPSLPKGGGAIKGVGEKFSVNAANGSVSFTVPIFTTPSRSDFSPKLSLQYDSGSGNGPFGLGWSLSVPSITRKTEKGLPRYRDSEDSDVFILSDAEDLVPSMFQEGDKWRSDETDRNLDNRAYIVRRYRPRIERLFARIERWKDRETGEVHWRSISRENIASIYGRTAAGRVSDPNDSLRVFKWLLEESHDDKGNQIVYEYKQEDQENVDRSSPREVNRLSNRVSNANCYLKRIKYGKKSPHAKDDYLFQVVFDYGEHDWKQPWLNEVSNWPCRLDSFSSFRAGFEIRTRRLCRRILMFHNFADELGSDHCLVRSTDFDYEENPVASFLVSVTQTGYVMDKQSGVYRSRSFPKLEFTYSRSTINQEIRSFDSESLKNLPVGSDGTLYRWLDLDSEGISGILTEQGNAWFYKRNLGNARFGPEERLATYPSVSNLRSGRQEILDLSGNGRKCLVQFSKPIAGYQERDAEDRWGPFTAFTHNPNVSWNDPNLKLIDLGGDGFSDLLISDEDVFRWFPSRTKEGFEAAVTVPKAADEERGPQLVFADSTHSIHLADMSGDGLTDIVRIRNGEICYWPNIGYGRFGAKVTMAAPPPFDNPDQFDPKRIRLADADGSGTTDIIYLGRDSAMLWFNQAGNSWSNPQTISNFPMTDDLSSVTAVDLFGNGTACLVWSSPLPRAAEQPMRYIDLMGGHKPHLLTSITNNMGRETRLQYTASTKFYLEDLATGNPWITKLPFPVQVLERVETRDNVSDTKLVNSYKYHHGYYDGVEREFRGFGLVESWDTESFEHLAGTGSFHVAPIHTKTWFHTGSYAGRENLSRHFAQEYYDGDPQATLLPDTVLPGTLTAQEEQEACRALKGRILRQEVYAEDGSVGGEHPYSVSEHNYEISFVQPALNNPHAVFFASDRETLEFHYERDPKDPRVAHQLTLEVDEFGNVTKAAAIGYPRRPPAGGQSPHAPEQTVTLITYTENGFENKSDETDWYRIGVPIETRSYELTGVSGTGARYTFEEMQEASSTAAEIRYEIQPDHKSTQKRLVECTRTLYYKDDLSGAASLGEVESHALPYQSYKLAFTVKLLDIYDSRITDSLLRDEGQYVKGSDLKDRKLFAEDDSDDLWWVQSGRQVFEPAKFYLPSEFIDPFIESRGLAYETEYDAYSLLVNQSTDPLGNTVSVVNNYRTMQPEEITDANGNRSQVAFDALGMVVGTAVLGKESETNGDSLADFQADLDQPTIAGHVENPIADAAKILQRATTRLVYDLERYARTRQIDQNGNEHGEPVVVCTLIREKHQSALASNEQTNIQHRLVYSDGFGREIQTKIQAEAGPVDGDHVDHRWVGTGWTIFNNKGKAVKKYEPFFSDTPAFEFANQRGVSSTIFYDPLERVVATLHPNHTYEKIVFDPWQQTTWDVNDTCARIDAINGKVTAVDPKQDPDVGAFFSSLDSGEYLPTWYADRIDGHLGTAEKDAATSAAAHSATPTVTHLDVLGRAFLTVVDNGIDSQGTPQRYQTHLTLDIQGNQRVITDALGRPAMINDFDMLKQRIHWQSIDAGERLLLNNVAGKPMRTWDGPAKDRNTREIKTTYDELQRPTHLFVKQGNFEVLAERTVFVDRPDSGLTVEQTQAANLRGRIHQHYDGAGVVTNEQYDFKGNLLRSNRQLTSDHRRQVDWSPLSELIEIQEIAKHAAPLLDQNEKFTISTEYDALNRPTALTTPDASVIRPVYNEANFLEQVNINLRGDQTPTPFITRIDYDAKGQRQLIEYSIEVQNVRRVIRATYTYDPLTFRLTNIKTIRTTDSQALQDLNYTYDAAGNITRIRDDAQQTVFFGNDVAEPSSSYEYDAVYRLIFAEGREHIGREAMPDPEDKFRANQPHPNDGSAMRRYQERYEYDAVGNILKMIHTAGGPQNWNPSWRRRYDYETNNFDAQNKVALNNRLQSTSEPGDAEQAPYSARYAYDAHGNMTKMPRLAQMDWDFKDQLQTVDLRGGGRVFYVYDSAGQRVRKVWEKSASLIEERIYLGGYEIFRRRNGGGAITLERETLHVMDDKRRIALVETRTVDVDVLSNTLPTTLTRYQLDNHLGSTSLELDESGAVISYEEYYPYGGTSYQAGRSAAEVSLKRYRYTGKERDEETGLYYHGARYYAAWLGRWTSCDPVGLSASKASGRESSVLFNLYANVLNNPTRYIDPKGLKEQPAIEEPQSKAHASGKPKVRNVQEKPSDGKLYEWASNVEDAHRHWKKLSERDKNRLLHHMTCLYGTRFAYRFYQFTIQKGFKPPKPVLLGSWSNKTLEDRGYRLYAQIPTMPPIWIHPSGSQVQQVVAQGETKIKASDAKTVSEEVAEARRYGEEHSREMAHWSEELASLESHAGEPDFDERRNELLHKVQPWLGQLNTAEQRLLGLLYSDTTKDKQAITEELNKLRSLRVQFFNRLIPPPSVQQKGVQIEF